MKWSKNYFRDWESEVFGFGYGSGEKHILFALKSFLELCNKAPDYSYDFEILERELTPTVAWLLINILCKANIIDYGSSPRFGWLTAAGIRLKEFIDKFAVEDLCEIVSYDSDDYIPRSPDVCSNPFWTEDINLIEEED